jgi:hypothetical protein
MVHVITPSVAVITVSDVNRVDEEKRPLWTRVVVTPSSVVVADKVKSPVVMSSEPVPFLFDVGGVPDRSRPSQRREDVSPA